MEISKLWDGLWSILPKINLLLGTTTSAFITAMWLGYVEKPLDISLDVSFSSPETMLTAPNMGVLLLFLLTLLYAWKYNELREGIDHRVLNTLSFMTMLIAFGTIFLPTTTFYTPILYENPEANTISRGIVITCSCYLNSPGTYAECINGLVTDCNNIMCDRIGDVICNNRFRWECGVDNKLHLTTCSHGCNTEKTECILPPEEEPKQAPCTKGTKCVGDILYLCVDNSWEPYTKCQAGCNYKGTNCVLDPVIIKEYVPHVGT